MGRFGGQFGSFGANLGPLEMRSHSTANPMSFWAEIRHLCDNPKRIRGNPLYGVRRGLGIGIFGAVLELFGVAGCTATRPVSHRRPPSPAPSCPPSGSASPATPRGAARAASTARVASEVPPPSLESVSFGVLFGVIYGFFGFLGGFGGFRWVFDGFLLGFCWVSVEFPLGSHWFHLIGFVLGSLSPPGPERVSFGVLFGVIYGFFGFLGGFGGFVESSMGFCWDSVGF